MCVTLAASEEPAAGRFLGTLVVTARPIEAIDANPLFIGKPIDALSAREVADIDIHAAGRVGTVADGVSALLLRVRIAAAGQLHCTVEGGAPNGSCEPLALRPSAPVDGTTVAAWIYTPPVSFGPGAGPTPQKYRGEVETREITLNLTYSGSGHIQSATRRILLARPPLVLVHGTFDDPTLWIRSEGGRSFKATVEGAGFKTFLVDYAGDFLFEENNNQGSFEANRQTVWDRPGGIRDALRYYRNELKLAAARADVVGHSLGGLLARVYASPNYASPDHPYNRPDNFHAGDINRLITLCTPHHGSAISALLQTLHKAEAMRTGFVATAYAKFTLTMARWWKAIDTGGGAVADQVPGSAALKRIGATPIPAFAIGCIASEEDADDEVIDPDGEYRGRVDLLSTLLYKAPALLQEYLASAGMTRESQQVPWLLDAVYAHWLERMADPSVSWLMGPPPELEVAYSPQKVAQLQAAFRAFLFLYDENDYTVGLRSQHGGLEDENRIDVRGVLHGPAPRYWTVQKRIIDILKDQPPGGVGFAAAGFPPAGDDPVPASPSKTLIATLAELANTNPPPGDPRDQAITLVDLIHSDAFVWGDDAIRWSGMVYAHALKFMKVAEDTESVFMFRPVNHDSTALIAANASTKPMAIKAKSSDWGPHRGLLPVDQAFSKKAEALAGTIAKYNCDAYDNLNDKPGEEAPAAPTGVQAVPFYKEIDGRKYEVVRTEVSSGEITSYLCEYNAEKGKFVPRAGFESRLAARLRIGSKPPLLLRSVGADGNVEYLTLDDAPTPIEMPPRETLPFFVFGDRDGKYMTADYDTLAIASRSETCDKPPFHPVYGAACEWQIALIRRLNEAAGSGDCKYESGNLVHHGPETNYTGSEYIDYPILAFIPGVESEPSRIVAIREGPPGYRDMHIKRLFFMLQQHGWLIDPNPKAVGWRWGDPNPFTGYELADQITFPTDVPRENEPPEQLQRFCEPAENPIRAVAQ
jgi:pimeloyl-ACP methyl ester carboxylesterase